MRGKPIGAETFSNAKMLIEKKLSQKAIAQILGVDATTVSKINGCQTYEAYREKTAYRRVDKPEEQKPTVADYYQINRVLEELRQQREQLAQCVGYMRECAKAFSELLDLLR